MAQTLFTMSAKDMEIWRVSLFFTIRARWSETSGSLLSNAQTAQLNLKHSYLPHPPRDSEIGLLGHGDSE